MKTKQNPPEKTNVICVIWRDRCNIQTHVPFLFKKKVASKPNKVEKLQPIIYVHVCVVDINMYLYIYEYTFIYIYIEYMYDLLNECICVSAMLGGEIPPVFSCHPALETGRPCGIVPPLLTLLPIFMLE